MNELFLKIVNMSISAGWLVLAVLLIRLLFKKAPKWVNVLLWGIVAVRLICPFSFESVFSLIPSAETISPTIMADITPSVQTGIPAINSVINPVIGGSFAPLPGASANPLQIWIPILSVVWVVGVAILLLYTVFGYWRLRRKVSEAVILRDNIFQCGNVGSPFVLGVIKPKVYLPYHMNERDLGYVIAHEQAHIRRRDYLWKPLGFLLLTIHWFNPLMWLAYVLLCRDVEFACDEKVIKELGSEQRADYTQALVACSVNRRMIAACPLAFGEVGVKERVKSVMNYKKPAFWIIVLAVISCAVIAVCFLTNPADKRNADESDTDSDLNDTHSMTEWNIDEVDMNKVLNEVRFMTVQYDGNSVSCNKKDINCLVSEMEKIKIRRTPVSQSRDETRDRSFSIAVNENLCLNFAGDFSEIWVDNGVKPSFSYPIANPETTKELLLDFYSAQDYVVYGVGAVKWFDFFDEPEERDRNDSLEINIPEIPDVTFRLSPDRVYNKLEIVKGDDVTTLEWEIWNAYFCDLTGDGIPELCYTCSWGSGIVDTSVKVFDYANGAGYSLWDRGVYDFVLRFNETDGYLYVDKMEYRLGKLVGSGRLIFKDDYIQIEGVPYNLEELVKSGLIGYTNDHPLAGHFTSDTNIN